MQYDDIPPTRLHRASHPKNANSVDKIYQHPTDGCMDVIKIYDTVLKPNLEGLEAKG